MIDIDHKQQQQQVSIRSVLCSYSSTDADYAEIPDDDDDADYAHPMAGMFVYTYSFQIVL